MGSVCLAHTKTLGALFLFIALLNSLELHMAPLRTGAKACLAQGSAQLWRFLKSSACTVGTDIFGVRPSGHYGGAIFVDVRCGVPSY